MSELFLWEQGWVSRPYWSCVGKKAHMCGSRRPWAERQRWPGNTAPYFFATWFPLNSQNTWKCFRLYRTWNWQCWTTSIFKGKKDPRIYLVYNYSNPNHNDSILLRCYPLKNVSQIFPMDFDTERVLRNTSLASLSSGPVLMLVSLLIQWWLSLSLLQRTWLLSGTDHCPPIWTWALP